LKLDRDKWQTDFEKQLDISEKKQIAIVKRFYKSEYNKGIESFIADGQTNFQNLFDDKPLLKIYSDLYTNIGLGRTVCSVGRRRRFTTRFVGRRYCKTNAYSNHTTIDDGSGIYDIGRR
jgi:hypothetical protein